MPTFISSWTLFKWLIWWLNDLWHEIKEPQLNLETHAVLPSIKQDVDHSSCELTNMSLVTLSPASLDRGGQLCSFWFEISVQRTASSARLKPAGSRWAQGALIFNALTWSGLLTSEPTAVTHSFILFFTQSCVLIYGSNHCASYMSEAPYVASMESKVFERWLTFVEQCVEALVKGEEYKCDRSQKRIHTPVLNQNISRYWFSDLPVCLYKTDLISKAPASEQKGLSSSWFAVQVLIFQHQQVSQSILFVAKWSCGCIFFHWKDGWTAVFKFSTDIITSVFYSCSKKGEKWTIKGFDDVFIV